MSSALIKKMELMRKEYSFLNCTCCSILIGIQRKATGEIICVDNKCRERGPPMTKWSSAHAAKLKVTDENGQHYVSDLLKELHHFREAALTRGEPFQTVPRTVFKRTWTMRGNMIPTPVLANAARGDYTIGN